MFTSPNRKTGLRRNTIETAIEVQDLHKAYGAFEAVRGVDFDVKAGEVFCLLGPNGAGKTTVTEILEGYRDRTSGSVSVLGCDPAGRDRSWRQRIGIVLQDCSIQGDLSVSEVLSMYGSYYPRSLPPTELMELVELDTRPNARVRSLSGGQRRRLDVALALAGDPALIFLDEPTTGFDPAARRNAWSLVRTLAGLGKTVFLTTHFMDEAEALADRIAVVAGGKIVARGTPDDLGGRRSAPAVIRFSVGQGEALPPIPSLDDVEIERDGAHVLITTPTPLATTNALTGWALQHAYPLQGFSVSQPTLEDIYLSLTASVVDDRVATRHATIGGRR